MRSLKEIYPEYENSLNFVVIGHDLSENLDQLKKYREQQGYPSSWIMAVGSSSTIESYGVLIQATKFVVDGKGVIVSREGYGVKSLDSWREVLDRVTRK